MKKSDGIIQTSDGVSVYFKKFQGASDFFVVFVHGLFGNTEIFSAYESILEKAGISYINFDLRGFGKSELKNVSMEWFVEDLRSVISSQLSGFKGDVHLVGYSMGTVVSSMFYERFKGMFSGGSDSCGRSMKLVHVSPLLFIRKRKILFNLPMALGGKLDRKLPSSPLAFIRIIWELLRNRSLTNVKDSVMFVGDGDFCFLDIVPMANTIRMIKDNHYILYQNPEVLGGLLVQEFRKSA